jgi:large subunit ribosomal protein L17
MRHRKEFRRLGRPTKHRMAMLRNLVTSLLKHERVITTIAKGKDARRIAEKMVTLGKNGSLASRRRALAFVKEKDVVAKLFSELAERYRARHGGYTRIFKTGRRAGDGAFMAVIELIDRKEKEESKEKKEIKKSAAPVKQKAKGKEKAEKKKEQAK